MKIICHALFIGLCLLLALDAEGWRAYLLAGVAWSHSIIALTGSPTKSAENP